MRNLVLLGEKRRCAALGSTLKDRAHICDMCRVPSADDGTESRAVLLTSDGILIHVNEYNELIWTCNLSDCCEDDSGEWFNVTAVDQEQIVCLSRGGAIVTVSPSTGVAEVVGEFENGLEAGQWSPDREVLLLVTFVDNEEGGKNSVILSMNAEWDVLAETTIEAHIPNSQGDDSRVHVCWRPDASLCAVSTVDVVDQTRRIRTYKRESLELNSVGRSEDGSGKVVPSLLPQIAWASGGCSNLLTSVQRKGKRTQQVVFFEPNGLRHRDFPLRPEPDSPHATVLGLDWNIESDLLVITLREPSHDKVQLWHRSNYHWYLKQELRIVGEQVTFTKFDAEQSYILYVGLCENDLTGVKWREYEFKWDTSTLHTTIDPSPTCTAVSIDGCFLNLTPLDKALVPPPMYAATISMDSPIREVAFAMESKDTVQAIAYLSDGSFAVLGNDRDGGKSQLIANYSPPSIIAKVSCNDVCNFDMRSLRQVLVVGSSHDTMELVAIACGGSNEQRDCLLDFQIHLDGSGSGSVNVKKSIVLESSVLRMVHWTDTVNGALLHLSDGSFLEYRRDESGEGVVLPSEAEPLLEPCPWISALHDASVFDQGQGSHRKRLVVGLSARLRLYCHDRLLADAASSFILSRPHQFLCFATADARSVLKSLPLKELHNFDPLMGSDENYLLEGYEPRNVERGTRLVSILPENAMAVLQMPRGNMEGIYPRSLVLPFAMTKIDQGEYGEAFTMMRRQKVDLNLIVDVDPVRFLDSGGVEKFLEQVIPIDYLNLFIACLQNVDVTQFRYRIPDWLERRDCSIDKEDFDFGAKVNQVCKKLRTLMIEAENEGQTKGGKQVSAGHFLLPVLSTFAKESPPKLEEALSLIKDNALAAHPSSSRKPPLFGEKAQSSIQYLAFLADYELLFNTSLGMYDYELARAVARNSQMDPKVYLPLLKHLKSYPEFYGKYEVDVRLGRYEAALANLVKSAKNSENLSSIPVLNAKDSTVSIGNDFEHCMALIESHVLHRLGLELFRSDPAKSREIMLSLGNQLLEKGQAKTALAVFLAAEPPILEGARQAARKCGDWKFLFSLPFDVADENEESIDFRNRRLANEIAKEIAAESNGTSNRRILLTDAARVLLDYGQDIVGTIEMLISGEMWSEGRRIASLHSRQDLVKKCVDAATTYAGTCIDDFDERTESFQKANDRYIEVLKLRKAAIRESGLAPDEEHDANVDDSGSLFSMASNASLQSNMSGSSMSSVSSSVSSVITVGAQSTFSISSEHELAYKHKSKFNKLGKEKKKKKKKKRQRNKRIRPGSEEELKSLVNTLKVSCADPSYCEIIADTVTFLGQVGKLDLARQLFESYNTMKAEISSVQKERIDAARCEKEEHERKARREGFDEPLIVLEVESDVNSFSCAELPETLHHLFFYLQ